MSVRGFLGWYLGVVLIVGVAGASAFQILARQHQVTAAVETPVVAAAATPAAPEAAAQAVAPVPAPATAPPAARQVASLPPPLPPIGLPALRQRAPAGPTVARRAAHHKETVVAATAPRRPPSYAPRQLVTVYPSQPYPYYPYSGYYAYAPGYAYYAGYPQYGYYRAF
jgi:hypothetical protein